MDCPSHRAELYIGIPTLTRGACGGSACLGGTGELIAIDVGVVGRKRPQHAETPYRGDGAIDTQKSAERSQPGIRVGGVARSPARSRHQALS